MSKPIIDAYRLAATVAENGALSQRVPLAIKELRELIDGGDECRGQDSRISHVIGILEGDANHLHLAARAANKAFNDASFAEHQRKQATPEEQKRIAEHIEEKARMDNERMAGL